MPRFAGSPDGPSTADLAARVKAERERLGLNVTQAAKTLGIKRSNYYRMERATTLEYGQLLALVRLGMDPAALAPELVNPEAKDDGR